MRADDGQHDRRRRLADDGTALVNSGVIAPGSSFALTFTKAGTFPDYCLFHNAAEGMVGTVTVTP